MLSKERIVGSAVLICAILNWARAAQSSSFFVKSERQSTSPNGSEKSEFDYFLRFPRGDLHGTASSHYGRYYSGPQDHGSHYQGAYTSGSDPFSSGYYGLAFVAPSSYGYGSQGAYGSNHLHGRPSLTSVASLGPGRYAFPIFDYSRGFGGFGGLGYLGQNLGFAYPGYGLGNKIFGEGIYPMRHT